MQPNTEILTGFDKLWVRAQHYNSWYLTNKTLSVLLSAGMALVTASKKPELAAYAQEYPLAQNTETLRFVYWLLFIYYSFKSLDELIELYAVYFHREKGALGLLLEMNYFLGIALTIYILVLHYSDKGKVPEEYSTISQWLAFQVYYFYFVVVVSGLVCFAMYRMYSRIRRKKSSG